METISVIIPFYNAGQSLANCLDSITNQDYPDLEIILVDDGSTDNSAEIVENYRQNNDNLKVLYQAHAGAAAAFNLGLAASNGDEIMFVSASDFLGDKTNLSELHRLLETTDADVAVANYFEFNNDDATTFIHTLKDYQKTFTPEEWFKVEYQQRDYLNQCFTSIYGKLFKKELLKMVDFDNEAKSISDGTTWKIYLMADHITYVNRSMYVVRQNDHSATYRYETEDHHSLAALEERTAILTLIDFNVQEELAEYVNRLKYHRDHALDNGDYDDYLNAVLKLEIIDQYN
ncbi:glycosyltransferase family 2 protein [Limosilactobacillus caecicola]|uniref:glycosyltransferase family 2 protein n=1 Tax=Limosilactobacillus caecicola TaxID=2941332 RepID=UPI00203F333D|nr:glycosyltransferase family 2 protein [Limosilactobacillus caecicola]